MKKLTKARLLGDAIRRTLIEFMPQLHEEHGHLDFDEYGAFKVQEWVTKQENICALTVYNKDADGEKSPSKVFAVAIDREGNTIDFHVEGQDIENDFDQYENYFNKKSGGRYVIQRVAGVLQSEFGIAAQRFLSELHTQSKIVREEHDQRKQARLTLKTLGY